MHSKMLNRSLVLLLIVCLSFLSFAQVACAVEAGAQSPPTTSDAAAEGRPDFFGEKKTLTEAQKAEWGSMTMAQAEKAIAELPDGAPIFEYLMALPENLFQEIVAKPESPAVVRIMELLKTEGGDAPEDGAADAPEEDLENDL